MRFYNIQLTNPTTGAPILFQSLGGLGLTSLLPNGQTNPAALNIELDIPIAPEGVPGDGDTIITIWGLGLQDIRASFGLGIQPATGSAAAKDGAGVKIFGGMAKGLPLANPAQQGPLVTAQVKRAFGNWVGTEQTVCLILTTPSGDQYDPKNIVLNWQPGQLLSTALNSTLSTAFPGIPLRINISPNLVQSHAEVGFHWSLDQLNSLVNGISKSIIKTPSYRGVQIINNGTNITVSDSTVSPATKQIAFQDMVGQPTWIDLGVIQVKLVMRGDLAYGDNIILPPSLVTTTGTDITTNPSFYSTFAGSFNVIGLHHYGNFREADASSWVTVVNALVNSGGGPNAAAGSGAP